MLTKEMVSESILGLTKSMIETINLREKWCSLVVVLEKSLGKELVESRWAIGCTIEVDKSDLPKIRKVVGRFKIDYKTNVERNGKDMIKIVLMPESQDWSPVRFSYMVNYRPGKCKIIEQQHSYKTLVCER